MVLTFHSKKCSKDDFLKGHMGHMGHMVTSQVYMFEEITSSSWPVEVGLQLGSDL